MISLYYIISAVFAIVGLISHCWVLLAVATILNAVLGVIIHADL